MNKAFKNVKHNVVHLKFPNGNTISTIWGYGSYTENHDWKRKESIIEQYNTFMDSNDVEVMIDCRDKLSKRIHKKYNGDGSVIGHLSIIDWLYIVNKLAK